MEEDLEESLKKSEKGPLDKFKHETLIYKQFGDEGVKAYAAILPGSKARDLLVHLGGNEARLIELLEFMDSHGLIIVDHGALPAAEVAEASRKQEAAREIVTEISERESELDRIRPASSSPSASAQAMPPARIDDISRPASPSRYTPTMPPNSLTSSSSITPPPAQPSRFGETSLRPALRPPSDEEKDDISLSSGRRGAMQETDADEGTAQPEPRFSTSTLSPLEKTIYQKFGRIGLNVYNLIDGEKTAEEILNETGISEVKLVEILEFMDKEGIIRLEKPSEEKAPSEEEKPKPRFEPMLEEKKEAEETIAPDVVPLDLPIRQSMGFPNSIIVQVELALRFPHYGSKAYNSIDGQSDVVQIATAAGATLGEVDKVLEFLGRRGGALMRPLKPMEVRSKYGDDGLAIYKKHGREGILVYELIGKEGSVREIVRKSGIEKNRAVDIFIYIHKVLGLDLPVDKQTLLRQIG